MDLNTATISVCMIVKSEEAVLARCLQDASMFADEIVILDTGSADHTREIASKYTDRIYDFTWCDDFAAARNASFEKATCDYVMWLDADDLINQANCEKINQFKRDVSAKLIMAEYDKPEFGCVFLCPRMVKRGAGFTWKGIIHECLVPEDPSQPVCDEDVAIADFVITHAKVGETDFSRNIQIMEKLSEQELLDSFWLCAQCFLDCSLAGEKAKAVYYLNMARNSRTPFPDRVNDYALVNRVLKHHKKHDALIQWNAMYLECRHK